MDPTALLIILLLTIALFYACAINTGADVPVADSAHGHGHGPGHDHDPDSPHGEPGEVAHPREHG